MRVVVFGGSGWVGGALLLRLAGDLDVLAPTRSQVDVTRPEDVAEYVCRQRPDAVVNLAVAQASATTARMVSVNAVGAGNVALAAAAAGARLVHVSTDMVLDGRRAPYADGAPPAPVTMYGETKASGEAAVLSAHAGAVIARTSIVYDPRAVDRGTESFVRRLAAGTTCRLFTDEVRCPIARGTFCDALLELMCSEFSGTLNVAGPQALSRYDFGLRLLRHFRVPGLDRVQPALAAELSDPRPLDLTLDVSHAAGLLGTRLLGVDEELART